MVRIILEPTDIIKLITDKYKGCEILTELKDEIEIRVDDVKPREQPVNNDANLKLPPQEKTIPGGKMGRVRNSLPVF